MDTVLFLLHIKGLKPLLVFYFRVEEKFAGGTICGRKMSREENFAKFHSQWILFSREQNFAQMSAFVGVCANQMSVCVRVCGYIRPRACARVPARGCTCIICVNACYSRFYHRI